MTLPSGQVIHMATLAQGEEAGFWTNVRTEVVSINTPYYDYLQKGDTAYLHRNEVREAFGHSDNTTRLVFDDDGGIYIIVKDPEMVVMYFRGERLMSPPHRFIVTRVEEERPTSTILFIPETEERKYKSNVFHVEAACDGYDGLVGKKVIVGMKGGIPVEYAKNRTTDKEYWWCREDEIMAEYVNL